MPNLVKEANRCLEEVPVDKLHLLGDRILCRAVKKSSKAGRFILAGQWEYAIKTLIGRVLKTGEDYDGPLQPGDYCIYRAWTGREFASPDETLVLLYPSHIEAIVERE